VVTCRFKRLITFMDIVSSDTRKTEDVKLWRYRDQRKNYGALGSRWPHLPSVVALMTRRYDTIIFTTYTTHELNKSTFCAQTREKTMGRDRTPLHTLLRG